MNQRDLLIFGFFVAGIIGMNYFVNYMTNKPRVFCISKEGVSATEVIVRNDNRFSLKVGSGQAHSFQYLGRQVGLIRHKNGRIVEALHSPQLIYQLDTRTGDGLTVLNAEIGQAAYGGCDNLSQ